ncbi:MAG: glycosyltransferase [Flavobacteriales bacterium]
MPGAKVFLVICHTFPPYQGIGGRRWAKFAKAMARKGHQVHVVCSDGSEDLKGSLWTADRATPGVTVHELPQRYPTVLFKRPLRTLSERLGYNIWIRVLPLLIKGNWFDKAIFWEKQLLVKCGELIERYGIRTVIVSGAPFSLMTFALRLKVRHPGTQVVADFRDPWTWIGGYGYRSLPIARQERERSLEARAVLSCDKVISPAPAIIEHLQATYGGPASKYQVIPHAFDPDELPPLEERHADGMFRMIYAGNVYNSTEATAFFQALFDGLEQLGRRRPDLFAKTVLDIYITDGDVSSYRAEAVRRALGQQVRFHEPLSPKDFFMQVSNTDLALVYIAKANKDFLGTKFNELFHLRRPVLHIGDEGLVSDTITTKRLGASVRLEELAVELPRFITGERTIDLDTTADVSDHSLEVVTDQLLGFLA